MRVSSARTDEYKESIRGGAMRVDGNKRPDVVLDQEWLRAGVVAWQGPTLVGENADEKRDQL
jgi:hypothetical protein